MNEKEGYVTVTYRLELYQKHFGWMQKTKELYNQILAFYYNALKDDLKLLQLSNQRLLRELEIQTIGEKRKNILPVRPLPFEKIPLYFRRAAINSAISMMRSYYKKHENWKKDIESIADKNQYPSEPKMAYEFNASPIYYAGMYKEFTNESILLKIWNGEKWKWVSYRYKNLGRPLPIEGVCLSPTIYLKNQHIYLHIPVKLPVYDIRGIKERLAAQEHICAVYFPSNNNLAVCVLMDEIGQDYASLFLKGGDELRAKRRLYEGRMKKQLLEQYHSLEEAEYTKQKKVQEMCKPYWDKIKNLNEHYAHMISRQIVNYCMKNNIKIIAMPRYQASLHLSSRAYLKDMDYDWIGRRIAQYTKYKAFQAGIVVGTIKPYYITSTCSICQADIKRYNQGHKPNVHYYGGELFICPNGHQGNTALNAAKNVGKNFIRYYKDYMEDPNVSINQTELDAIHLKSIAKVAIKIEQSKFKYLLCWFTIDVNTAFFDLFYHNIFF